MFILRAIGISLLIMLFGVSVCGAQDFSTYRGFHFGANAEEIGKHIGSHTVDLKVIHQRPALIEQFEWNPYLEVDVPVIAESLRSLNFTFYNHELFRIVVTYDPAKTEGLISDDVIEAISRNYGKPTTLNSVVSVSAVSETYPDNQKALAVWENAEYSYTLFRTPYGNTYGLIILSKRWDALAKVASEQAVAQDKLEAPQQELDRQKQQDLDRLAAEEKARATNKPHFRP